MGEHAEDLADQEFENRLMWQDHLADHPYNNGCDCPYCEADYYSKLAGED